MPRFPGDGLDFRTPVISSSTPVPDIIDLTGDQENTPPEPVSNRRSSSIGRPTRPQRQDIIDLEGGDDEEVDITEASGEVTEDEGGSSDVEILYTNQIRPPSPPRLPRASRTLPALPPTLGAGAGWTHFSSLFQHMPIIGGNSYRPAMGNGEGTQHQHGVRAFRFSGQVIREEFADDDVFRPMGFRLPALDFETTAFHIGRHEPPQRPSPPRYTAPSPVAEGFTRTLKDDDVPVCPHCDAELGVGETDLQKQVWVVKSCGHVSLLELNSDVFLILSRSTVAHVLRIETRR